MYHYFKTLNHIYRKHSELYELDHDSQGFEWIDPHNIEKRIIALFVAIKQMKN